MEGGSDAGPGFVIFLISELLKPDRDQYSSGRSWSIHQAPALVVEQLKHGGFAAGSLPRAGPVLAHLQRIAIDQHFLRPREYTLQALLMGNRGHHSTSAPTSDRGGTHLQAGSQSCDTSRYQLQSIFH